MPEYILQYPNGSYYICADHTLRAVNVAQAMCLNDVAAEAIIQANPTWGLKILYAGQKQLPTYSPNGTDGLNVRIPASLNNQALRTEISQLLSECAITQVVIQYKHPDGRVYTVTQDA